MTITMDKLQQELTYLEAQYKLNLDQLNQKIEEAIKENKDENETALFYASIVLILMHQTGPLLRVTF